MTKPLSLFSHLLILSIVLQLTGRLGAAPAFAAGADGGSAPQAAPSQAPAAAEEEKSEAPKPTNPRRFRKSRLTSDVSEGKADRRRLLLTTGEDKTVDLDFEANTTVNGISIGNPLILATTLVKVGDKRQIVFKPLKPGETTVTVRDVDGTIRLIFQARVTGSNLLRIAGEVRELLRDIEGINIRIVGPKIIVEGEVLVPNDYGRLYAVVSDPAYKDYVLNLTILSPMAMQVLARKIQEDIQTIAPKVTTRVVNGVIFLEGSVENVDRARRAAQIAEIYLPEVKPGALIDRDQSAQRSTVPRPLVRNFIVIDAPPPKKQEKLVRIMVHFVELSKDYASVFGFKWAPGFTSDPQISIGQNATGDTSSGGASFSATLSSLIPKLQNAQTAGYARVLKTGTVVVRSGQPASLEELTEVPFVVPSANGTVTPGSAKVGLSLGVTPLILGQSEDIQLELKMNQSNAVGRMVAGTAPITSNHKVETKIYVKSNESAAVAAVNASDVGTDFNKDDPNPGTFGDSASTGTTTQAIFSLMHSKNYHKKKSQFVIFVTPQIIENASDGTEDLKKNFRVKVK